MDEEFRAAAAEIKATHEEELMFVYEVANDIKSSDTPFW